MTESNLFLMLIFFGIIYILLLEFSGRKVITNFWGEYLKKEAVGGK